jgi:hypothetical protein
VKAIGVQPARRLRRSQISLSYTRRHVPPSVRFPERVRLFAIVDVHTNAAAGSADKRLSSHPAESEMSCLSTNFATLSDAPGRPIDRNFAPGGATPLAHDR